MSNLRVAILYEMDTVWIEYTPDQFRKMLIKYHRKYKSVAKALDAIEADIRTATKHQ